MISPEKGPGAEMHIDVRRKKLLIALYQNRGQTTRGQIARRFGFDRKTSMDRFLLQTGGDEKAVLGIPIEQLCYLNSLGDTVSIALWLNMARGMQKVGREITSRGLLDWFNKEYIKLMGEDIFEENALKFLPENLKEKISNQLNIFHLKFH